MLPEKYSYFRRVEKSSTTIVGADESVVVDCVICMVPVDMAEWSTESMVHTISFFQTCATVLHSCLCILYPSLELQSKDLISFLQWALLNSIKWTQRKC
jgi:hypothetical protein